MEDYEIAKEYIKGKRDDVLTNDEACMATAIVWALRSKDPSTQVGACFVNTEGRIISAGYNGTPKGWNDDEFPWLNDTSIGYENTKYPYVIHAEVNGIMNYSGPLSDFRGSTLYVTLFPCSDCARYLASVGVKKIVYLNDDRKYSKDGSLDTNNKCSKILLKQSGIEYVSFNDIKSASFEGIDLSLDDTKNTLIKRHVKIRKKY